jgi:hypothetical protein
VETTHNIRLTSAEIANLWSTYMSDCMAECVLKYFLEKVEDTEIRPIIEYALHLPQKHIRTIKELFKSENITVPQGFTDEDVNLKAPRLYSDAFFLHYIKQMSRIGLNANSLALALSARLDVMEFYNECLASSAELNNKVTKVMLSKGIYVRAPYMTMPNKVDFIEKQNFLTGFFGEKRPLLAVEITHLYANIQTNSLGKALVMGFGQVAQSQKVRDFMMRGKEIGKKQIDVLGSLLTESDISNPVTWDGDVMESTVSPFSDKIMMFHTQAINAVGMADYGASIASSLRSDLATTYIQLAAEVGQYSKDGIDIMINNHWMEQPPQATDRKALAKQ